MNYQSPDHNGFGVGGQLLCGEFADLPESTELELKYR